MKAKFTINVNALNSVDAHAIDGFFIEWLNVTDRVSFSNWFQDEDLIAIESTHDEINFHAEYSSGSGQTLDRDFDTLSTNGVWISFTADCSFYPEIQILQNLGVIMDITPLAGESLIYLYSLNSANNVLNKDITLVEVLNGKFNHLVGLKNLNIDIINYHNNYNYAYIPSLNRYYYVDSVEFVSGDYTRLHLREDVLMSWQTLIKNQSAFITRQENTNNNDVLVDTRLPLEDKPNILFKRIENTPSSQSRVNVTFNLNVSSTSADPVFLVSTKYYQGVPMVFSSNIINAPTGSGLSDMKPHYAPQQWVGFMTYDSINDLLFACLKDTNTASFLDSIIWLPFNPITPFSLDAVNHNDLYIGGKKLKNDGTFVDYSNVVQVNDQPYLTDQVVISGRYYNVNACPYLIAFDFSVNIGDKFYEREPYTNYEIHIPFVGFVKVESKDLKGSRLFVYYSMDLKTGLATAYLYNYTKQYMIWSGQCQLGVKLDITQTNLTENIKQRQSADLNMIMGMLSSALSIGVGIATENPVAIAGGVLSGAKTIASNVNTNRMIFNSASTTYGSSDGILYDRIDLFIKMTTHNPITIDNDTYKTIQGYPANVYDSLTNLTGYTEIGEIQFNPMNETIYQNEIEEIVSLLKLGVIL